MALVLQERRKREELVSAAIPQEELRWNGKGRTRSPQRSVPFPLQLLLSAASAAEAPTRTRMRNRRLGESNRGGAILDGDGRSWTRGMMAECCRVVVEVDGVGECTWVGARGRGGERGIVWSSSVRQSNDQRLPTTVGAGFGAEPTRQRVGLLELVWGLSLRISMALRDRCRNSNGGLSLKVFFLLFFYCVRVLQSQCFPMYTTYYMSLKNAAMNINRYPWGRGELYDRSCLFSKNEIMH